MKTRLVYSNVLNMLKDAWYRKILVLKNLEILFAYCGQFSKNTFACDVVTLSMTTTRCLKCATPAVGKKSAVRK